MARLGKRERQLKRATIKRNMNDPNPPERTDRWQRSYIDTNTMLGRTHAGYREPQNAKGLGSGGGGAQRFSEPARVRADNRATYVEAYTADTRREAGMKRQSDKPRLNLSEGAIAAKWYQGAD